MSRQSHSRRRSHLIDEIDEFIEKEAVAIQGRIFEEILRGIINDLEKEDGRIMSSTRNIIRINAFFQNYKKYQSDIGSFLSVLLQKLDRLFQENIKYFRAFQDVRPNTVNQIKRQIFREYGYDPGSQLLIKNGRISDVLLSTAPLERIKRRVLTAIAVGMAVDEFINFISNTIKPPGKQGLIDRYFEEVFPDLSAAFDRKTSTAVADRLSLNWGIYQGGIIRTSRDFCRVRNNRVFSRAEIAKFGSPDDQYGGYTNKSEGEFKGKTTPYEPFSDLGGYNCRHQIDWISDELAKTLRPDISTALSEAPTDLTHQQEEAIRLLKDFLGVEKLPDAVMEYILRFDGIVIELGDINSRYYPGTGNILIDSLTSRDSRMRVILHELAHKYHFESGLITFDNVGDAVRSFYDEAKKIIDTVPGLESVINREKNLSDYESSIFSDVLASLTKGLKGAGRPSGYWDTPNIGFMEFFANSNSFRQRIVWLDNVSDDQINELEGRDQEHLQALRDLYNLMLKLHEL